MVLDMHSSSFLGFFLQLSRDLREETEVALEGQNVVELEVGMGKGRNAKVGVNHFSAPGAPLAYCLQMRFPAIVADDDPIRRIG